MFPDAPRGAARRAAHVLVLCDLSPDAMNAAWRAALLAREQQVPLRLLHHGPQRGGEPLAAALASFLAEAAQLGAGITPIAVRQDALDECVAHARDGLLVVPAPRHRGLRDRLLGSPAERLARRAGAPVLVVKQPARGAYRRVVVPVDLAPGSADLLAVAATLSRGARVAVFHAVAPTAEVLLRELEAPPAAWRAHRSERESSARTRIEQLIAHDARQGSRAVDGVAALVPLVGFGRPADSVLAAEAGQEAELIVMGPRRRGLLSGLLPGSVTRQVIARSRADVLVLPLAPERAGSTQPAEGPEGRAQPSLSFLRRAAKR